MPETHQTDEQPDEFEDAESPNQEGIEEIPPIPLGQVSAPAAKKRDRPLGGPGLEGVGWSPPDGSS
jgi:hypothetical protein